MTETAQRLFILNALIWFIFGAVSLVRMAGNAGQWIAGLVIGILMLGNVGAMAVAAMGMGKRNRWFFYFGLGVLVVNIVLTVTDEFGVFDFITLAIDVVLLGLLLANRSDFMPSLRS